jgi:hypothetical protein
MMSARLFTILMVLIVAMAPRQVDAASITFTEVFTYPDVDFPPGFAGQAMYIGTDPGAGLCDLGTLTCTRAFATVLFDLTSLFNTTTHESETVDLGFNVVGGPNPISTHTPTTDASGYVPGTGLAGATLTVTIRGLDLDADNVRFTTIAADGSTVLHQTTYAGAQGSTAVVIPLDAALLGALSADGQLGVLISSWGNDLFTHDFNVESARLDATVPEPSAIFMLGVGLAGALRRRLLSPKRPRP